MRINVRLLLRRWKVWGLNVSGDGVGAASLMRRLAHKGNEGWPEAGIAMAAQAQ
jgi:hypothetical protein